MDWTDFGGKTYSIQNEDNVMYFQMILIGGMSVAAYTGITPITFQSRFTVMNTKFTKILGALALSLGVFHSAWAIPFELHAATATLVGGNTTSAFYQFTPPSTEAGSASSLYSSTVGGSDTLGFWLKISFDGNPQPILESAFMKASNNYLWWDSSDLAGFNAGSFDSIILWQDGITNQNDKYQGISHGGINGKVGETTSVPDGGATALMLVLGFISIGLGASRRIKR